MPSTPSIAEEMFNRLQSLDQVSRFAFVNRFVAESQEETTWLDFKGCGHLVNMREDWVANTWSKYLSAFGNTGGGLIVWGIKTEIHPKTKKDCATDFNFVPAPGALLTRLDQLQHTHVEPPIPGVKHLEIFNPDPAANGNGLVVSLVPDGPYKPHFATFDGRPYLRVGGHCEWMPRAVVQQLFYPRMSPYLGISMTARWSENRLLYDAIVHNRGSGTAREPVIVVHARPKGNEGPATNIPGWRVEFTESEGSHTLTRYVSLVSIHPGAVHKLQVYSRSQVETGRDLVFTFTIHSVDTSARQCEVRYLAREADDSLPRVAVELPMT